VLAFGKSLQPIVFLFWIEIAAACSTAVVRAATSFGGRPFVAGLAERLFAVVLGVAVGGTALALSVAFSIGAFEPEIDVRAFGSIRYQAWSLAASYGAALILEHFLGGRFRSADPMSEIMGTLLHVLAWLALLMPLTMHLLPRFPGLDRAWWAGFAVLAVKLGVDLVAAHLRAGGPPGADTG
jgi:hypothetical protein